MEYPSLSFQRSRYIRPYHQAEVEDATNDIKAGVLQAEQVQVLAAQLHAAGGGGVGRHAAVLPTPPQLCLLIILCLHSCCCRHRPLTCGAHARTGR